MELMNKKDKKIKDKSCYYLHQLIDNGDIKKCKSYVKKNNLKSSLTNKTCSLQLGILFIQYYLLKKKITCALNVYYMLSEYGRVRKRHIYLIIYHIIQEEYTQHQQTSGICRSPNPKVSIREGIDINDLKQNDNLNYYDENFIYKLYIDEIIDKFELDLNDLNVILSLKNRSIKIQLLNYMINMPFQYSNDSNKYIKLVPELENIKLYKYTLCENKQLQIQNHIFNLFSSKFDNNNKNKYVKWLSSNEYDIILDGANILYFHDLKITLDSYIRLDNMINCLNVNGNKILLILHKKYLNINVIKQKYKINITNIINTWQDNKDEKDGLFDNKKCLIFETDYGLNDDLFILLASLQNKPKYIVTNDKFRDHIYKLSKDKNLNLIIKQWFNDYTLNYKYNYNLIPIIDKPLNYSKIIQKIDDNILIPTINNDWIIL